MTHYKYIAEAYSDLHTLTKEIDVQDRSLLYELVGKYIFEGIVTPIDNIKDLSIRYAYIAIIKIYNGKVKRQEEIIKRHKEYEKNYNTGVFFPD